MTLPTVETRSQPPRRYAIGFAPWGFDAVIVVESAGWMPAMPDCLRAFARRIRDGVYADEKLLAHQTANGAVYRLAADELAYRGLT